MDLGLTGRVAIVAGGSKGLGRAIAEELLAEGARVAIAARGKAGVDEACETLARQGGRVIGLVGDVSVVGDVTRIVSEARRALGSIDILVTNSGGPRSGPFDDLSPADWDAATRVLLTSAVEFARAVLPDMRERRWGRIINITSIAAKQPVDGLMLSNSLRAAVIGFARTLANEIAVEGITVNNLVPGYTRTARVVELADQRAVAERTTPEAIARRWEEQIPMRRLGEPRELAALAAFLASERASYITGQSIAVDGGWIKALM